MKFAIFLTIKEIRDAGHWYDFCEITGWDEKSLEQGKTKLDLLVSLTLKEAENIGLIKIWTKIDDIVTIQLKDDINFID